MLDFLIITLLIVLFINWIQSKPFYWRKAGIPYSIPLPILGNTAGAFFQSYHDLFGGFYNYMGDSPFYGFHLFGTPALMAKDPEVIQNIMGRDSDNFMSHGFHAAPYDPLCKGLFFADGQEWKAIRSKMTPYFTPARLKAMLPLVKPLADKFTQHIIESGKNKPVDVAEISKRFTVDVIITTAFGLQSDSLDNPKSFFYAIQSEMISFKTGVKLLIGDLNPSMYAFFGFTSFNRSTTTKLQKFVDDIIDQRLGGVGTRPDFMQGMIELMQKDKAKESNEKSYNADGTPVARFDDFTVAGQCMMMYAAGTETTGNVLSFILYEFALNPDVQEKAREEINNMIQRTGGNLEYEDLVQLKYIHKVFYEGMRKYPAVGTYSRKCTRAIDIKGVHIPVGTKIMLSPYAMHKNPVYYPEPEKFIPERFSEESKIIPGSYIPYGHGPRTCIGIKFAEIEIALALCKLLPRVKLSVCHKTEIPLKLAPNPTLSALNGIWLTIEEIK